MIGVNTAMNTEVNCLLKAVIGDPNGDYTEGVFAVVCLSLFMLRSKPLPQLCQISTPPLSYFPNSWVFEKH